ncbi:hypothetical protein JCM24511_06960 [Saitozyma sp. JCM 24511]|nr:hypothetical protein JCM24511_06960 [Saitozyma sp. JCM 24511]
MMRGLRPRSSYATFDEARASRDWAWAMGHGAWVFEHKVEQDRADVLFLDGPFFLRWQEGEHERKQARREVGHEPTVQ